jgi:hypothetical protein
MKRTRVAEQQPAQPRPLSHAGPVAPMLRLGLWRQICTGGDCRCCAPSLSLCERRPRGAPFSGYICAYIHTHTHIHTYIYTHTYTHTHTHTHTHITYVSRARRTHELTLLTNSRYSRNSPYSRTHPTYHPKPTSTTHNMYIYIRIYTHNLCDVCMCVCVVCVCPSVCLRRPRGAPCFVCSLDARQRGLGMKSSR